MIKEQHKYLKLLSILLQYPDDTLFAGLPELEKIVEELPPSEQKKGLEEFLCYLKTQKTRCLQELYTAAFDMNPSTTLNITYHLWGDSEKRAGALTSLRQIYQDAGYECTTGELPDYLPMMLEFLAVCPKAQGINLIWECLKALEELARRLQETALSYSKLLQPLIDNCGN